VSELTWDDITPGKAPAEKPKRLDTKQQIDECDAPRQQTLLLGWNQRDAEKPQKKANPRKCAPKSQPTAVSVSPSPSTTRRSSTTARARPSPAQQPSSLASQTLSAPPPIGTRVLTQWPADWTCKTCSERLWRVYVGPRELRPGYTVHCWDIEPCQRHEKTTAAV
jgi:hypothetical protein